MSTILQVDTVTKRYGSLTALDGVSLSVDEGQIVGLLGPNGSGKTTLIKILNGLLHGYEGSVTVDGHEPGAQSKALVAYLPDREVLPGWMTVQQSLGYYADFFADFDMHKAEEMLLTLRVDRSKRVRQLSKGMREKLQLTLTMARKARLYVLDEPIAGVDPAAREVILSTILQNYGENSAILMSTHIISDVESIFDRAIFLKEGRVVLQGEAEALRAEKGLSLDGLFREVFRC